MIDTHRPRQCRREGRDGHLNQHHTLIMQRNVPIDMRYNALMRAEIGRPGAPTQSHLCSSGSSENGWDRILFFYVFAGERELTETR
jgi:hypothetical protein